MLKQLILQSLKLVFPLFKQIMNFEVFAYLATGAANTLLNIGLFLLIKLLFTNSVVALEAATIISFTITVFTGFWLQKNFAFINSGNEIKETRRQFGKYSLVALQGQVSAYLLTKSMIVFLKINASTAYVVTAVIILTLNYFLQKFFTFKKQGTIMY